MALTPLQQSRARIKQLQRDLAKIRKSRDPLQNLMSHLPTYEPYSDEELEAKTNTQLTNTIRPIQEHIGRERAHNEHIMKVQQDAANSWGQAQMYAFTGGQPGQAGMDASHANYGGSYLPAIAAQNTSMMLNQIAHDFDEKDWQASQQLADLMDKVPGLRQDIENDIVQRHQGDFKAALDSYGTRVQLAGLMLDQQNKEESIALAKAQLGYDIGKDRNTQRNKDRDYLQDIADKRTTATGKLWVVKNGKVVNTGKTTVAGQREARIASENKWKRNNLTKKEREDLRIAEARERRLRNAAKKGGKDGGKIAPRDTAYVSASDHVTELDEDMIGEPVKATKTGNIIKKDPRGKYKARPGVKGVYPDGTTDNPNLAQRSGVMPYQEAVDYAYGEIYPELHAYGYSDAEIRQLAKLQVSRIYSRHNIQTGRKKKPRKK